MRTAFVVRVSTNGSFTNNIITLSDEDNNNNEKTNTIPPRSQSHSSSLNTLTLASHTRRSFQHTHNIISVPTSTQLCGYVCTPLQVTHTSARRIRLTHSSRTHTRKRKANTIYSHHYTGPSFTRTYAHTLLLPIRPCKARSTRFVVAPP